MIRLLIVYLVCCFSCSFCLYCSCFSFSFCRSSINRFLTLGSVTSRREKALPSCGSAAGLVAMSSSEAGPDPGLRCGGAAALQSRDAARAEAGRRGRAPDSVHRARPEAHPPTHLSGWVTVAPLPSGGVSVLTPCMHPQQFYRVLLDSGARPPQPESGGPGDPLWTRPPRPAAQQIWDRSCRRLYVPPFTIGRRGSRGPGRRSAARGAGGGWGPPGRCQTGPRCSSRGGWPAPSRARPPRPSTAPSSSS